jgi:thioredoxin-related protein
LEAKLLANVEKKFELIKKNRKFLQQELSQNWQQYCAVLSRVFFSEQNLREIFNHFSIETGYEALGLEYQEYQEIVGVARFVRNRFTCLDL